MLSLLKTDRFQNQMSGEVTSQGKAKKHKALLYLKLFDRMYREGPPATARHHKKSPV
jgi:hypothetical protein